MRSKNVSPHRVLKPLLLELEFKVLIGKLDIELLLRSTSSGAFRRAGRSLHFDEATQLVIPPFNIVWGSRFMSFFVLLLVVPTLFGATICFPLALHILSGVRLNDELVIRSNLNAVVENLTVALQEKFFELKLVVPDQCEKIYSLVHIFSDKMGVEIDSDPKVLPILLDAYEVP